MKLKHAYVGTPHIREIRTKDFKNVGVDDQELVRFTPENGHTAEVSEKAGRWLLDNEPGDWELIDESTSDGESSNASGSGEDDDESGDEDTRPIKTARRRPPPS